MKRILIFLLILALILAFAACKNIENTSSDALQSTSENQTVNNTQSDNEIASNDKVDGVDVSSTTDNSDPTAHTHSFSAATCTESKKCSCGATDGKALGHKWAEATCKAPKTCSVCKKTEGNTVDHVVSGTTCKWCKQVVPVSPTLLKKETYYFRKLIDNPFELSHQERPTVLFLASIDFTKNKYMDGIYIEKPTPSSYFPPILPPMWSYDNMNYFVYIDGYPYQIQQSVSDNHIVITIDTSETQGKIEFELLSDNTLRVVSMTNIPEEYPYRFCLSVGDIFK